MSEPWRTVWRNGIVPLLSIDNLRVLAKALADDDARLIQGATCVPLPCGDVGEWFAEAACPLGYIGAYEHGGLCRLTRDNYDADGKLRRQDVGGYATIAQVDEFFARMCQKVGHEDTDFPVARYFTQWWDDHPREEVRPLLLQEIQYNLGRKIRDEVDCEIHLCPPAGSGTFPCCGKTPLECPETDRMTEDPAWVSCGRGKEVADAIG